MLRFDIILCWLPRPNTTLLVYSGLRPTINIGGVFVMVFHNKGSKFRNKEKTERRIEFTLEGGGEQERVKNMRRMMRRRRGEVFILEKS